MLLFEDEFSLSNSATLGYRWSLRGRQPRIRQVHRRRERKTGMGSLNPLTGQITVTFHERGNYQSFKKHLKKVLYTYRHHSTIILVVDNVPFHHARLLDCWLATHPQLEIVYLPPYSPELNPVERAWWYMRKHITHNRYLKSMEQRMIAFWKMFSHFHKPNEKLRKVCVLNY